MLRPLTSSLVALASFAAVAHAAPIHYAESLQGDLTDGLFAPRSSSTSTPA